MVGRLRPPPGCTTARDSCGKAISPGGGGEDDEEDDDEGASPSGVREERADGAFVDARAPPPPPPMLTRPSGKIGVPIRLNRVVSEDGAGAGGASSGLLPSEARPAASPG